MRRTVGQDLVERPGLGQHLAGAVAHRLAPAALVDRGGHHDDVGAGPGQRRDQPDPVAEAAQVQVEQHHPGPQPDHGRGQRARGPLLARHGHPPDVVPLDREGELERLGEQHVVLDDEDAQVSPRRH